MTSLEFIEKQIDVTKNQLAKYPLSKEQSDTNYKHKEADIQYIYNKYYTKQLQTLLQIKTKLEAWEITKRELGLKIVERSCGAFGSKYALKCDYEDVIPLLDTEAETFKKALEVEDGNL